MRFFSLSTTLLIVILLAGCSSDDSTATPQSSAPEATTQEATAQEATAQETSAQGPASQSATAHPDSLPPVTVYKSPTCGCCADWVTHMEENGFTVETKNRQNVNPMKDKLGVPQNLRSCHTAVVDGEVVEGHVPASLVKEYLSSDARRAAGLAVPGMPVGSPGMEMEGREAQPYNVFAFTDDGRAAVYAQQ